MPRIGAAMAEADVALLASSRDRSGCCAASLRSVLDIFVLELSHISGTRAFLGYTSSARTRNPRLKTSNARPSRHMLICAAISVPKPDAIELFPASLSARDDITFGGPQRKLTDLCAVIISSLSDGADKCLGRRRNYFIQPGTETISTQSWS